MKSAGWLAPAILLGLAAVAAPRPAAAQFLPLLPSLGLGVHGGAFSASDGNSGGFGGAHVRLRLLPFLGLEASVDVREASYAQDVTVLQVPAQLSALLYLLPAGPLQLYVAGGIGYYYQRVELKGADSRTSDEVGYHGGAGVDLPLGFGWVLNADARYDALNRKVEARPGQELGTGGWQVRGGITYYFW